MTVFFLDSSALVKRFHPEVGSDWITAISDVTGGHQIVVSDLTSVEVLSSAARRMREGLISRDTAMLLRTLVDQFIQRHCHVIRTSELVTSRAKDLLLNYPLRAYDAIQLAAALESSRSMADANLGVLVFVCADIRPLNVATAELMSVENPNSHT